MALTFNQFFSAIAEQESGGNYKAKGVWVNGDRAYGKYQIMGKNLPSWTRKHYGKSLTPDQFLSNPKAQEAVARGVLQSYWNKYGARGAASAWYSGNANLHMSTKSQPGGPSIKGYVDQVLAKASKYPTGGASSPITTTSSGGGGGTAPADRSATAEAYGFMEALFDSVPELKRLFDRAVKGGWAPQKFQASLRDTKWWKTTSASGRDFLMLQYGDPATAKQKMAQMRVKLTQYAKQMGAPASDRGITILVMKAIMGGWDDAQIRWELGKTVYQNLAGDKRPGEAGEIQDKLSEYAYAMGVPLSSKFLDDAASLIVSGRSTQQDYEDIIRRYAKASFGQWTKQIDSGQTVADLAAPYLQTMAQILELPAGSVDLFDKTVKGALQYKDPQSGKNSVKPLWQFENELRSDNRWKATKNAQDSMMQVAHQVLSDFGVKY